MARRKKSVPLLSVIILIIVAIVGYISSESTENHVAVPEGCEVTFADVGQGDCTLIRLGDGTVMLIDSGEYEYRERVEELLISKGISTIDYLVATHPHSDHMGSMSYIIDNFDVDSFYMPKCTNNTTAFEKMLESLDKKNIQANYGKSGDVIFDSEYGRCTILSPVADSYESLNDYSIVIKLTVGSKSFLFAGDAETTAENMIYEDVDADLLKVGHHGSSSSTSEDFLNRVSPEYAVISCGRDNSYGHPHEETKALLDKYRIDVYRTDTMGDITFYCDGNKISSVVG